MYCEEMANMIRVGLDREAQLCAALSKATEINAQLARELLRSEKENRDLDEQIIVLLRERDKAREQRDEQAMLVSQLRCQLSGLEGETDLCDALSKAREQLDEQTLLMAQLQDKLERAGLT